MDFNKLKCISDNVNIKHYMKLYKYVRDNMPNPEWLGTFTKEEINDILSNGGKIWLYYDNKKLVCSMLYIPVTQQTLDKRNANTKEEETGALGPIMVSPDYIGNKFMSKMLEVFNSYCLSINKKYIFTKAQSDNIYSINNMYKDGYKLIEEHDSDRGKVSVFLKKL